MPFNNKMLNLLAPTGCVLCKSIVTGFPFVILNIEVSHVFITSV